MPDNGNYSGRLKRCFCDLDGVLADFHRHWHTVTGRVYPDPWPPGVWWLSEIHGITFEQSCEGIDLEYWQTIPWMPDGKRIIRYLQDIFPADRFFLLTANTGVTDAATAAMGKIHWIERELPAFRNRYFMGAQKEALAHPNNILIDDRDDTIEKFNQAGGQGFLLPRPWNAKHAKSHRAFEELYEFIRGLDWL